GVLGVWDAVTRRPVSPPVPCTTKVTQADFSADGRRVVIFETGPPNRPLELAVYVRVWDTDTDLPVGPPLVGLNEKSPRYICLSREGSRVATGGVTGAWVWAPATGTPVPPTRRHEGVVTFVAFSPDGGRVVTAGDQAAGVWDAASGEPVTPPLRPGGSV